MEPIFLGNSYYVQNEGNGLFLGPKSTVKRFSKSPQKAFLSY